MVKENLLERIRKIKSGQTEQKSGKEVRHLTYRSFPDSTRQKCARNHPMLKRMLALVGVVTLTFFQTRDIRPATLDSLINIKNRLEVVENSRQQNIQKFLTAQTTQLQNQILSNISMLQEDIKAAKRNGKKDQTIKKIFDTVYERGGLSGDNNYCVAGAMYAQQMCQDTVLRDILPDPSKTPQDYNFSSHPNVSCPYMREFFQKTFGENYAERGDKNFKDFVNTLEAGDIITIPSSVNTSSREHCVTCAGPVVNGKVPVKSLNSERNYEVAVTRIVGAAKVMKQYRGVLTQKLEKEMNVQDYILLASEGNIFFMDGAAKNSKPAGRNPDKSKISQAQGQLVKNHSFERI